MRKFLVGSALLLASFAAAQTIVPTTSKGNEVINRGDTTASVSQNVNLILPEATALHLTASNLEFDISKLGAQDSSWYCAYGLSDEDKVSKLDNNFWDQTQTLPLGTSYTVATYPNISVNAGNRVTSYPPAEMVNGKVDNASKRYFVCYRTFILQKFSNVGNYRLSVSRDRPTNDMGHPMIYMQEDPCNAWGSPPTGLYKVDENTTTVLTPRNLTIGTSGRLAAATGGNNFCRAGTSWLDDVIVVAVVVDGDRAGTNTAVMTYTLESSATPFQ